MIAAGITALLGDYAAAWAENRSDALTPFWDADAFRFYKAEEIQHVYTSFDEVRAYWQGNEAMHDAVRLSFAEVQPMPVEGRWTLAFATMRWDIRFRGGVLAGKAMGGENRVLMLVTESDAGLRFAGWSETPDAPITYIRQLYERQAQI